MRALPCRPATERVLTADFLGTTECVLLISSTEKQQLYTVTVSEYKRVFPVLPRGH